MSVSEISSASASSLWDEILNATRSSAQTGSGDFAQAVADNEEDESSSSGGVQSFDPLDTNQDGQVSLEELEKARPLQQSAEITKIRLAGEGGENASEGRQGMRGAAGYDGPASGAVPPRGADAQGMELTV